MRLFKQPKKLYMINMIGGVKETIQLLFKLIFKQIFLMFIKRKLNKLMLILK